MIKNLLFAGLTMLISVTVNAQCTTWVDPAPDAGWIDLGSAPCNGSSTEVVAFEVYKSEAYALTDVVVGGNYTFSVCNGPGAGSWVPDFTIIAPSGAVDAFGAGDGDGCSITWTATEEGDYLLVINEAGACGVAGAVDNGFPMITTNSGGAPCAPPEPEPVMIEGAESFEASETDLPACWQAIDADGDGNGWNILVNEDLAFNGMNAVRSESYNNDLGVLTPDNYLITPSLDIVEDDSLYFVVNAIDPDWPAENYSVLVSTTGTEIADFTDEVFAEVLADADYHGRSVNLDSYAGQTIHIAFRHFDVTNEFAFLLDAVWLPGVVCSPDAVNELTEVESTIFPNPVTDNLNITTPLEGAAVVRVFDNLGRLVLTNNVTLSNATFSQSVAALENGMYTIQISTADEIATERFVKQ